MLNSSKGARPDFGLDSKLALARGTKGIQIRHTCGDGGSLYKNVSELFFFPLSNKAERLGDYHHTSSFLLFFPSLLHYTGVCMQHCPS